MNRQQSAWLHLNADVDESDGYPFANLVNEVNDSSKTIDYLCTAALVLVVLALILTVVIL